MRNLLVGVAFLLALSLSSPASAQSLLGLWRVHGSPSTLGPPDDQSSVAFALGYDELPQDGTPMGVGLFSVCIGCATSGPLVPIVDGENYIFTPANSPHFASFADRITDDRREIVTSYRYVVNNNDGTWEGGGAGGNYDTDIFVSRSTWHLEQIIVSFQTDTVVWAFLGTGDYGPSPIPEPAAYALMGLGLVVVARVARRRG
jgi:hypothetical protein